MRAPWLVIICLAATIGSVARYVSVWDEPWDRGVASINGAYYHGQPVLNWNRGGFGATRGIPLLALVPTKPFIGFAYTHHPPTFAWATYAVVSTFGFSERSFRLLPAVCSGVAGCLLMLLVFREGIFVLLSAAALWLVLPMSFLYGYMCNTEAAVLAIMMSTVLLHDRLRTRGWAYGWVMAAHLLGCVTDWEAHFIVPALFAYELLQPRGSRRISRIVALGCVSVVGVAVVLTIRGFFVEASATSISLAMSRADGAAPSFQLSELLHYLLSGIRNARGTAQGSLLESEHSALSEWARDNWRNMSQLFTWPALATSIVGVAIGMRRRSRLFVLGITLLVPGVLRCVAFRTHSMSHEFWAYHATCGIILLSVEALRQIRYRVIACAALSVIVLMSLARIDERLTRWRSNDWKTLAAEIDRFAEGPEDIIVWSEAGEVTNFYVKHWTVSGAFTAEHFENLYVLARDGRIGRPVVFLLSARRHDELRVRGEFAALKRIDPSEVLARSPAFAMLIDAGPLWIARVE